MKKNFKFTYASELAGIFILVAVILILVVLFLAGREQGWFEGNYQLRVIFVKADNKPSGDEGSFGVQEKDDVKIVNTKAGHVKKIMPVGQDGMEAILVIKNRFKPFVRKDSTLKVKKTMFGVAGDSFIEISRGNGELVDPEVPLKCVKDQQIVEQAQKALANIQDVVVPMLNEVKGILKNVNEITSKIETGKGLAGTIINDPELSVSVKSAINKINAVLEESRQTVIESRRLIQGVQKHWLIRKYISQKKEREYISPLYVDGRKSVDELMKKSKENLDRARLFNQTNDTAMNAYNLAACCFFQTDYSTAEKYLEECRINSKDDPDFNGYADLLECAILRNKQDFQSIDQKLKNIIRKAEKQKADDDLILQLMLMRASLFADNNKIEESKDELDDAGTYLKETEYDGLRAIAKGIEAKNYIGENNALKAAECYDAQADGFSKVSALSLMTDSLVSAGRQYEKANKKKDAADRYYRAARSKKAMGENQEALVIIKLSEVIFSEIEDASLKNQLMLLKEECSSVKL